MSDSRARGSSRNSKFINAPREDVYRAFIEPEALAAWLAPDNMTGKVHEIDARVGGGYVMSLFYSSNEEDSRGKTSDLEDRFYAMFVELSPPEKIVEVVTFDSDDPSFSGEMSMVVTLRAENRGTNVVIEFSNIPPGIRPADNETGTRMSLEKLARYFEQEGKGRGLTSRARTSHNISVPAAPPAAACPTGTPDGVREPLIRYTKPPDDHLKRSSKWQ